MNLTIGHLGCHCCRHYKYSRNFLDQLWKHSGSNPIMQSAHLYSHHHHLIIRNKKLQESIILPRNLIRNIDLQFFLLKVSGDVKELKKNLSLPFIPLPVIILMIILMLIITIMIMIVNHQ